MAGERLAGEVVEIVHGDVTVSVETSNGRCVIVSCGTKVLARWFVVSHRVASPCPAEFLLVNDQKKSLPDAEELQYISIL